MELIPKEKKIKAVEANWKQPDVCQKSSISTMAVNTNGLHNN